MRHCLPLPVTPYEACEKRMARVSSMSLVRYRTNDYSVPTEYGHRDVLVKGYVQEVVIVCGSEMMARHRRSYKREDMIFDPLHYLALLEQKTRALDQAAPLVGWELPECFASCGGCWKRGWTRAASGSMCRCCDCWRRFRCRKSRRAVDRCAAVWARSSFDAVKHLLLCRIERRPPRLDLENYPHLPLAEVRTTQAAEYMAFKLFRSDRSAGQSEVTPMSGEPNTATVDTPQVLLEHHLKQLRLPTFLREYDKVARQCAAESVDYPRYLLRLTELELLDRERRATERRIHQARFPVVKSLDSFRVSRHSVGQQGAGAGTGALRVSLAARERAAAGQLGHRQDAPRAGAWSGRLVNRPSRALHDRGGDGARTDRSPGRANGCCAIRNRWPATNC